jgi:A/G-specific adenine glycosylase
LSQSVVSNAWKRSLAANLLKWFGGAARDLPWRRTRDLYAIWVSEIMLQQTQVATVIPFWQRFLGKFPDPLSLAAANESEVLRLWEGLGYYRRARQLHAAAIQIVAEHGGAFPTTYDDVRSLPGIGRYTAGAILSIGLDQRLPILEANTIRVLSRLTACQQYVDSGQGQNYLWSVAEAILPRTKCGAFNQSLMELGSQICTVRSPNCERCPVARLCQARQLGLVDEIPRSANRKKYEDVTELAVVIRRGSQVLLRHCQPGDRWAGLWDFPRFRAASDATTEQVIVSGIREATKLDIQVGPELATIKHSVTRFRITLKCYEAQLLKRTNSSKLTSNAWRWVPIGRLAEYPLSVTGRKISNLVSSQPVRRPARGSKQ